MKRMTRLWMVAACAVISAPAWAQTRWEPLEADSAKMDVPAARIAALEALPPGSVSFYGKAQEKTAGAWKMTMPDGGELQVGGWQSQTHSNGDVSWSGYVKAVGGSFPVLLTHGAQASFVRGHAARSFPARGLGRPRLEVREDHPRSRSCRPTSMHSTSSVNCTPARRLRWRPLPRSVRRQPRPRLTYCSSTPPHGRAPSPHVDQYRVNHLVAVANQVSPTVRSMWHCVWSASIPSATRI